jgi:hypothetical protein
MRKILLLTVTIYTVTTNLFAGGLLTNTNQNVHFLRNPARDASTEIDAVYSNPAGLAFIENGFHLSLNIQSAFQTRTIVSTLESFSMYGGNQSKTFKGEASAPVVPSFQAAYKKEKWTFSGSFAVTGGGGKATFNNGLASFEAPISMIPTLLTRKGVPTTQYSVNAYMEGSQIIYGLQLGATYKITDYLSAFGGFRMNYVNNNYEGYLRDISINPTHPVLNPTGKMMLATNFFNNAMQAAQNASTSLQPVIVGGAGDLTINQLVTLGQMNQIQADQLAGGLGLSPEIAGNLTVNQIQNAYNMAANEYEESANNTKDKELDCSQTGWGVTPVIGMDFKWEKLNVGVKYEFNTHLNVENKTKRDDTGQFPDGVNTPHDIPALLTVGVSYEILPVLKASAGYHHFFDKQAKMANDRQKYLKRGTNEFIFGVEWDALKWLQLSGGVQRAIYGLGDGYMTDLSFNVSAWSFGVGAGFKLSEKLSLNVAYLWSNYDTYTKKSDNYNGTGLSGTDVFTRTNKVFGVGMDYHF